MEEIKGAGISLQPMEENSPRAGVYYLEKLRLWKTHAGAGLSCRTGKTHSGAGDKCEEEGAAEMSCYGLTTSPIPHPPALLRGEGEDLGMKE